MTNNAINVLRDYLNLSETERKEIDKFIKTFSALTDTEKSERRGNFLKETKVVGPLSGTTCPYCGR